MTWSELKKNGRPGFGPEWYSLSLYCCSNLKKFELFFLFHFAVVIFEESVKACHPIDPPGDLLHHWIIVWQPSVLRNPKLCPLLLSPNVSSVDFWQGLKMPIAKVIQKCNSFHKINSYFSSKCGHSFCFYGTLPCRIVPPRVLLGPMLALPP